MKAPAEQFRPSLALLKRPDLRAKDGLEAFQCFSSLSLQVMMDLLEHNTMMSQMFVPWL